MYGFIHCCLEDLVMQLFGEEKWKEILERSNLQLEEGSSFLIHRVYTDEETLQLVGATCEVLGLELNACLETFGEHFLRYCQGAGFDRLLRVLGGSLEDFLTSLDFLHEHLASIYPGMHAPSFRCTHGENGVLMLHYYSDRKGLQSIVKGLVKIVSREFFDAEVAIEEAGSLGEHIVLKVFTEESKAHEKTKALPKLIRESEESRNPEDLLMNVATFCQAFPFHVVFDDEFSVTQVGTSMRRLLRHVWAAGERDFRRIFRFTRPVVESTFIAIVDHQNATFVAQTLPGVLKPQDEDVVLKLKGQMMPVPESSSMVFLCSPRVTGPDEMQALGLFLSDFRVHDFTRDLVLMRNAHRGERELMQRLEETTNQLKIADAQLLADKKRTEELLHSILPSKVASRLALNLPVPAEVFDVVSVLFSDIVGFTAMCSDERVKPIDIVQVLDKMYTLFDMLSGYHKVYKVETIGDAYMVVGGIPEFVATHADQVVAMGLAMVEVIKQVLSPIDQQPLKMRVGVHTGSVLAGVVGQQMPRYCLFGNTVTLGNKMESNGLPGRVNVSQETISHLTTKTRLSFEDHPVPNFSLKCSLVVPPPGYEFVEANLLLQMNAVVIDITEHADSSLPQAPLMTTLEKENLQANTNAQQLADNERIRHVSFHPDMEPVPVSLVCPIAHSPSHRGSRGLKATPMEPRGDCPAGQVPLMEAATKTSTEIPVAVIHPAANPEDAGDKAGCLDPTDGRSFLPRTPTYPSGQDNHIKMASATRGLLPLLGLALCSHFRRPNNPNATEWLERIARKQQEAASRSSQGQAAKAAKPTLIDVQPAPEPESEPEAAAASKPKEEGDATVPMTTRFGLLCKSRSFGDDSHAASKMRASTRAKNIDTSRKSAHGDRKEERRPSISSGKRDAETTGNESCTNSDSVSTKEESRPASQNSNKKAP